MRHVLFIHSAGHQGPEQGSHRLLAYLNEALGEDYNFSTPTVDNPENPTYEEWRRKLDEVFERLEGQNVLLIGHSFGASVLLKYITERDMNVSIEGIFLLASPYWGADEDWDYPGCQLQDKYKEKLSSVPNLHFYHSRHDPVVPYAHYKRYLRELPHASGRPLEGDSHDFTEGLRILIEDMKQVNSNDNHKL